jgi:hypothetical protein
MKNRPFLKQCLATGYEDKRHYRASVFNLYNLLADYLEELDQQRLERLDHEEPIDHYHPQSWHNLRRSRLIISMYESNSYLGIIFDS